MTYGSLELEILWLVMKLRSRKKYPSSWKIEGEGEKRPNLSTQFVNGPLLMVEVMKLQRQKKCIRAAVKSSALARKPLRLFLFLE